MEFKNLITLTQVENGAPGQPGAPGKDASAYYIETNQEEVLYFKTYEDINNIKNEKVLFSPAILSFKVFRSSEQLSGEYISFDENNYKNQCVLEITSALGDGFIDITDKLTWGQSFLQSNGEIEIINQGILFFDLENYYLDLADEEDKKEEVKEIQTKSLFTSSDFQILRFSYKVNGKIEGTKVLSIKKGVTSDMATFNLHATGFNAAIQKTKLDFSSTGLTVLNGGIKIFKKDQHEYFKTLDISRNEEKDYYEKIGENFVWVDFEKDVEENEEKIEGINEEKKDFEEGKEYYERKEASPSFWADEGGNLYLTGTVYATDGEFTGKVYATEGEFSGKVYATEGEFSGIIRASGGTVGGFTILEHFQQTDLSNLNKKTLYIKLKSDREEYYPIFVQRIDEENLKYYIYGQYPPEKDDAINFDEYYNLLNGNYIQIDTPIEGEKYYMNIDISKFNAFYENLGPRLVSPSNQIVLDGTNGKVIAENIELGKGAKITEYIDLSSYNEEGTPISITKIYNPSLNDKKFIETDHAILTSDGVLTIGTIELNGIDSTISGDSFLITPTLAKFSNIDCSGVIRTAIFENNKVQSVGGSMVFKPSYKIEKIEKVTVENTEKIKITIENTQTLESLGWAENDCILLINSDGKVINYNEKSNIYTIDAFNEGATSEFFIKETTIEGDPTSLIYIGKMTNIVIGINSNVGSILKGKIYGEGLTITTLEEERTNPNLFLGNLNQLGIKGLTGYGLYSDNVYLKGSLTTEIAQDLIAGTYAGINTRSDTKKNGEKVVFWAGATSAERIDNAPFIVTEWGKIYASAAIFDGSIITNSTIEGAHLYTTHIHGGKQGSPDALYIHDTSKGICFNTGYEKIIEEGIEKENFGETILRIDSKGLRLSETDIQGFISINRENGIPYVSFNGNNLNTTNASIGYLEFENSSIKVSTKEGVIDSSMEFKAQKGYKFIGEEKYDYFITFDKERNKDKTYYILNEEKKYVQADFEETQGFEEEKQYYERTPRALITFEEAEIKSNVENFSTKGNFTIGQSNKKLNYQLNDNGYDLYVLS